MIFQIPMCHRQFFRGISQRRKYVEISAMIWKILFILHVRNGSINKLKILCNFLISIFISNST